MHAYKYLSLTSSINKIVNFNLHSQENLGSEEGEHTNYDLYNSTHSSDNCDFTLLFSYSSHTMGKAIIFYYNSRRHFMPFSWECSLYVYRL